MTGSVHGIKELVEISPHEKQRKQLTIAFVLCGLFLVGFIVFAFISLPKYEPNSNVIHLQKTYEAIREIDYYIERQTQGGYLSEDILKEKIEAVTTNLSQVTEQDAKDVNLIWEGFKNQLSEQNSTFTVINDAIQLKMRVDRSTSAFYRALNALSLQFSEARSVSIETIRYIDQVANSIVRLQANITNVISSHTQVDIKTISELADSLTTVQKGLNTLLTGSPAEGVQSIKGSLEEESLIEAQFVFNQLAKDATSLMKDARGIVFLNQMKVQLQTEKDKIQRLLQGSIDAAYAMQQEYLQTTNRSVFRISLAASIGTVVFFTLFAFLFLRLNKSRLSIESEKNIKTQRIDEVMKIIDDFVTLKARLLLQLELFSSLNNESDRILIKGRAVKESSHDMKYFMKESERTHEYLEQALTHNIGLLKGDGGQVNISELRLTLNKQLDFFVERRGTIAEFKKTSMMIDDFFSNVVNNINDSVMAYREVEQELILMISEIDQLNRNLKE